MLEASGPIVYPPSVRPESLLASLPLSRHPLVLAPSSERGWFGGVVTVAVDPVEYESSCATSGISLAGTALDCSRDPGSETICAIVLDYEGRAQIATYSGGLTACADGWRTWGDLEASTIPVLDRPPRLPAPETPLVDSVTADMTRDRFMSAVGATREAIARGDVYVLNLTYRLTGMAAFEPAAIFGALLARGAGAMSAALLTPERSILSVSPERFLAIDGRQARIEPIKGTRRRSDDPVADRAWAIDLVASDKERAEHVMIVDLERNDLGRVSLPGSVSVDPLYEVVPTPYCHQLVSTVRGSLRDDVGAADVIAATFPCGSVTGAPKIAAMRHIAELESSERGAYCGALLVAARGRLDSSVLIRTAELRGERLSYGTGGGITYDSDPGAEWDETVLKSTPLLGRGRAAPG